MSSILFPVARETYFWSHYLWYLTNVLIFPYVFIIKLSHKEWMLLKLFWHMKFSYLCHCHDHWAALFLPYNISFHKQIISKFLSACRCSGNKLHEWTWKIIMEKYVVNRKTKYENRPSIRSLNEYGCFNGYYMHSSFWIILIIALLIYFLF